jgi:hypothetical protein
MSRVLCVFGAVVGALALVVPGVLAATSPETVANALESQIAVNRTQMMARAALLPRAESEAFWPLYREYEREREQLEQRARLLLEDYLKSARTPDDAATQALLERLFSLCEQQLALLRKYATALQARLPMRQAAEFVQTEFELMRLRDLQRDARLEYMR